MLGSVLNQQDGIGTRRALGARAARRQISSTYSVASEQYGMQSSILQGAIMHLFRATVLCTFTIIPPAVLAEPLSTQPPAAAPGAAESVRVQPRGSAFAPNSAEDDAVQKRITIFNATQGLLDASFDRKLTICRRC